MQVGFEVVDALAQDHGFSWNKKLEFNSLTASGVIHGQKALLCKPMAFMNVSGESVGPLSRCNSLRFVVLHSCVSPSEQVIL